ncbi:NAD-dependent epimerase [Aquabacterium sp.]|uniref:NAD-dependent epimerase n=1 Tax=Aquabacterium sp. TaxID=1872578 RepID=UPI002E37F048|nr:NAD-dependent epimerase [Aquabacterium sp.]HEX5310241.1 NAD-dependent epimerase [Aquabacterium sp.]
MKILVTGAAGFIGMHTTLALLARGDQVVGIDNMNDYYDPQLKRDRLAHIAQQHPQAPFKFIEMDVADTSALLHLFETERFDRVIHLAAQAGVRYSLQNPHAYAQSNLVGFVNILEGCRHHGVQHLVYASSSSVYGGNTKMPFSEDDSVDHPVSLYAATKKANELMAHTYSHLYGLPTTGLRFFTVYGPWGRPDMAPMLFTKAIMADQPIKVFNHGKMKRDFTYIDDIVAGVVATMDRVPEPDDGFDRNAPTPASSWAPYRVFNIGNSEPVELLAFIGALEGAIGRAATKDFQPMQPGDVVATYADTTKLESWTQLVPKVSVEDGVNRFVQWYHAYFSHKSASY